MAAGGDARTDASGDEGAFDARGLAGDRQAMHDSEHSREYSSTERRTMKGADQCKRRAWTARSTRRFLSTTTTLRAATVEAVAFVAAAAEPADETIAHEPNGPARACMVSESAKEATYRVHAPHEARVASRAAGAGCAAAE